MRNRAIDDVSRAAKAYRQRDARIRGKVSKRKREREQAAFLRRGGRAQMEAESTELMYRLWIACDTQQRVSRGRIVGIYWVLGAMAM